MRKIIQTILQAADSGSLTKIIFAGKRKKSLEYSKITLRPVTIRGEYMYQAEFHFKKKVTHQNIPYHEMVDYASQWSGGYSDPGRRSGKSADHTPCL